MYPAGTETFGFGNLKVGTRDRDLDPASIDALCDRSFIANFDRKCDRILDAAEAHVAEKPEPTLDMEGLLKVREAVEATAYDRVDMGTFGEVECGTAGCAIFHFCRRHPGDRLKLVPFSTNGLLLTPSCEGRRGFHALAHRFGILYDDAVHLFNSLGYGSPGIADKRDFLARLDAFLAAHQGPSRYATNPRDTIDVTASVVRPERAGEPVRTVDGDYFRRCEQQNEDLRRGESNG